VIEPTTWHVRSIVIDPDGAWVSVTSVSGKVQLPGVIVPLAAMLIGQAKSRNDGAKTACHVPTIMDWEHAGSFTPAAVCAGCWARAAVTSSPEIDAIDTIARTDIFPSVNEPGAVTSCSTLWVRASRSLEQAHRWRPRDVGGIRRTYVLRDGT
jgi:hypothetical protein